MKVISIPQNTKDIDIMYIDAHRFYFYDDLLVRWKYTNSKGSSKYYDLTFSDTYFNWESIVLDEVNGLVK